MFESCERIHVSRIPQDANVIGSHVLYKIKILDNDALYCKARIAPHGNHDSEKNDLKTDSVLCPLTGVRMLLSTCAHIKWNLTKVDVKAPFCSLERHIVIYIYVKPPRECQAIFFYCLLLVPAYGSMQMPSGSCTLTVRYSV